MIEFGLLMAVVGAAAGYWLTRYKQPVEFIHALHSPVIVLDSALHITALNTAAENLLHLHAAEVAGRPFADYFPDSKIEFVEREWVCKRPDERILRVSARVIKNKLLLELHDLTSQQEMEQKINSAEERFRILSEMTYDYTYSVRLMPDNTFQREWVTESFTRITGYPAQSDFKWLSMVHPDDLPGIQQQRQNLLAGKHIEGEYRIIRADGEIRWLRDYSFPIWDEKQEKILRFLGVARDITREKEAEISLRKLAEGISRGTGIPFMQQMVETLAQLLHMEFAYVGRFATPDTVQTIAFYREGKLAENMTYSLQGTPCETLPDKPTGFYLTEVIQQFPEDRFLSNNHIKSYLATPLFSANKQMLGLICLMSRQPLQNPDWAASLLQICAVRVSVDLERLESEDQLRARNRELEALRSIALLLGGTLDLFEIIDIALTHLQDLVPYERAGLALRYEDRLYFVNDRGFSPEFDWEAFEKWVNDDVILRETHTLTESRLYANIQAEWNTLPFLNDMQSLLILPICSREQTRGLVYLLSGEANVYMAHHAALGLAVMRQVATALENAQLYSDMENRVEERTNELQAQRDRTETILQNVADAIMFMDDEGRVLYVNAAWETLTGYSPDESLMMTFSDLYGLQTPPEISETMWETLRAGSLWRGLLKNTRKDGVLYDAEFTVVPVIGDHRFVSVHRDVTQARQYEEMQRRFISDAAHDLGNPVANLKLHLDLMQRKPENAPRYMNVIRHETERLDALVQDLLMLSRLDRGILAQHIETIDLRHMVQRVVENQREAAQAKNITLLYDPAPEPLLFQGDRRQIERVVVNLISNALDYTPEGGEVLVMSIREENEVVFAVRDTGIGISTKDLPHIFDRFYRADNARLMSAKGSGLGLSIVKSIVENHGGEIYVTSAPHEGTYFHVALPC